jgi:carboxylesterase
MSLSRPHRLDTDSAIRTGTRLTASVLGPYGTFQRGGRRGVLLVHGVTGAPAEMRSIARSLVRHNFTVACPQLEGHCTSVRALKATRWTDWYASIKAAYDFLSQECDTVYAAGLSVGALLALRLAAQEGVGLAGVAALSAVFFFDGWNVPTLKQRFLLPLVLNSPLKYFLSYTEAAPYGIKDERMRAAIAAFYAGASAPEKYGYSEFPALTIAEAFRLIRAVDRELPTITTPTLIVHAIEDDMASLENAHYLERRLSGCRVERFDVENTYHVLTLDKRKEDVAQRIANFFLECEAASSREPRRHAR